MNVTSKNIKTLPNGVHKLERGTYLRVQGEKRFFLFKYQLNGKRREIGLGGIDQPLTSVRAKAAKLRAMVAAGEDPKATAAEPDQPAVVEPLAVPAFDEYYPDALERIATLRQWRGSKTFAHWLRGFKNVASPAFGSKPLDEITPKDIADALRPSWESSTVHRFLPLLAVLFDLAISDKFITQNPAKWRGGVDAYLPSVSVLQRGKVKAHRAAVSAEKLRGVYRRLAETDTMEARCVQFGTLLALRSQEFRLAKWSEIDFEAGTLTVPPERRKDKRPEPFVVPLPKQALALLNAMPKEGERIFTAQRGGPLGDKSVCKAIQAASDEPISMHGCRSTFSDWCARNEKNFLVSEKCLMHTVGGQVFMAYQRDDLLDQRRKLLQEWADYLTQ